MIYRSYLGLDIGAKDLRAVSLRRKGRGALLTGGRVLGFSEGIIDVSAREPNVSDKARFRDAIREVLDPLSGQEERIALSLPDGVGRVIPLEIDTPLKTKAEGMDILKWQMKGTLPGDLSDFHLDYQVLEKVEGGRYRVLVVVVSKKVLAQYEEIVDDAGYKATLVDFHSLGVYNFYHTRIDLGENFVLVGLEGNNLFFEYFEGGNLLFHRTRDVEGTPLSVFQDISRTVVNCTEKFSAFKRSAVFLHSDRDDALEVMKSSFGREVLPLDPHLDRMAQSPLDMPRLRIGNLVAAVGMAERLM